MRYQLQQHIVATPWTKKGVFAKAFKEPFLDGFGVVRAVKTWIKLSKGVPVVIEYLFECIFIYAFHGRSLRQKIAELAG